jgi:hypothetical protein
VKNPRSKGRRPNAVTRLWRVLRATPAQRVAIDAVLGADVWVPPAKSAGAGGARFDEVERVLSLALDALINAIDSYRDWKGGRSV